MRLCLIRLATVVVSLSAVAPLLLAAEPAADQTLLLHTRSRVESPKGSGTFAVADKEVRWDARKTAIVICDMWDHHWCKGAEARVAEMAPRMNELITAARKRGVFIIHCPSGTMATYKDAPGRKLAQSAPPVKPKVPLKNWCYIDPAHEPALPIDDSDGGCDDQPACPQGHPWRSQVAALKIEPGDAITDSAEAYNLMQERGIDNLIIMGVHLNMCVLGRPFGIRQMTYQGKNVVLVRDMTDTMYNSRRRPNVSHFRGTDLMVEHVEKHWCPTITSCDFLGGEPFRFAADKLEPASGHSAAGGGGLGPQPQGRVASSAVASDDGLVVGSVQWAPNLPESAKTEWDKTDYWAAIAVSPSTGKYAASCEWTADVNATRQAREKCNAPDARAVVLCCNGWCALALGKQEAGKDIAWGVGWGADQATAEKYALQAARDRKLPEAKVVYSINSREMRTGGAIAYSASTGKWGYATGGGRSAPYNALQNCKAADAKVVAQESDCWMALALGDDASAYGWGHAGNRADAERFALEDCNKRTKNAKIAVSFCTNGVVH